MIDVDEVYESYFDIDPSYHPIMTEALINEYDEKWKGFYPHETFVSLLKTAVDTLSRQLKKSLWVTGSYGTGKTHAVLTLKRMLEAQEEDIIDYFKSNDLDENLLMRLKAIKSGDKRILTVYRYGSSEINSIGDLTYAIHSSIKKAMKEQGMDVTSTITLKDTIVNSLENDSAFATFIDFKIKQTYRSLFSPYSSVEQLITILKNGPESEVRDYVTKYLQMLENEPMLTLPLDAENLVTWIDEVIKNNNIKAIFFVWDEFTEFFKRNINKLTGFQMIVESTQKIPFILTIVTHISEGQLSVADNQKIMDRFAPTIDIKLPDNMAFRLMGKALAVKPEQKKKWDSTKDELWENVKTAGNKVINSTNNTISEDDFKQILPFHPYAALLLKHVSSLFNSNQRSMFEYIKDGQSNPESNNFKSFIHRTGPYSSTPYLTCDVLWDYFFSDENISAFGKDMENLYHLYLRAGENKSLDSDARAILKTTLLLQVLSEKAFGVTILRPTLSNLNYAFSGSEINQPFIQRTLDNLVHQGILSTHPGKNNETEYLALNGNSDSQAIEQLKGEFRNKLLTLDILQKSGPLEEAFKLTGALELRYSVSYATSKNIVSILKSAGDTPINKIPLIITFAKDTDEYSKISQIIKNNLSSGKLPDLVIADVSNTTLSEQDYDSILEAAAYQKDWEKKQDTRQASSYENRVKQLVSEWIEDIRKGTIDLYTDGEQNPRHIRGEETLTSFLMEINQKRFNKGIEGLTNNAALFKRSQVNKGVKTGVDISVKPKGMYNSLGDPLKDIWNDTLYWKNSPNHLISHIKLDLDEYIHYYFKKDGRIDFWKIWEKVSSKPYGFMPCDLTAFVLGFLLKEYATSEYAWSNGSASEAMSTDKLAELIEEAIKATQGPPKSKKFIVQMSEAEKNFLSHSAIVFNLDSGKCTSIEATRNLISNAIKTLEYPLWALKSYLNIHAPSFPDESKIIIMGYCEITRNDITDKSHIKDKIEEIGKLFQKYPGLSKELNNITNAKNTRAGMQLYVKDNYPKLILYAQQLNDESYLDAIKSKFSADSPWLWSDVDINKEIERVCSEYRAFVVSNSFIGSTNSTTKMMAKWVEKLENIRVPLTILISAYPEIEDVLRHLITNIQQQSQYVNLNFSEFASILENNLTELQSIFSSDGQKYIFAKYCGDTFPELGNDQELINEIYSTIPKGQISTSPDRFEQTIRDKIQSIKCVSLYKELNQKWLEKSGFSNPSIWSNEKKFPILLLFDKEMTQARKVFEIITNGSKIEKELIDAISFLDNPIFAKIGDDVYVHDEFVAKIVKGYAAVIDIDDLHPLMSLLISEVGKDVYSWVDAITSVNNTVSKYSDTCYRTSGYQKVYAEIDNMTADDAKEYLKSLIKDDVDVGIAIIRKKMGV